MPQNPLTDRSIFLAAIDIASPVERDAYLARVCGDNAPLRAEIQALLAAHGQSGDLLDVPDQVSLTIDQPLAERPGTRIGPYKLLQQIGEGGMGVVYMAEQHEPVKRRVALKIIKPGMDTRQVIARFEAERQALSLMDHPNIAKVLDAGTTDSGRPYFVMELVKGQPITEYCDERHLTPRQRLELLLPVCQAIQHAHQKGIIHRDIKPTNILVAEYDEKPVPKVIDFGVAKAIGSPLTEKTMFTGLGQIVGTLEYMSPEQAKVNQLDIDTRSDIYSLGVLLYELLTGSTPFDRQRLRSAAFDEMLRIIREEEPPKPSTRLSDLSTPHAPREESGSRSEPATLASIAALRQTEPAKLTKLVRGELDWIVMKALEKDRSRRYETANGFAADVQRYLNDEPVQACPPSMAYQLRKFTRRNRLKLIAAGVLSTALLVAIGGIGWAVRDRAAQRADVERDKVERLARASSTVQPILVETDRLMAAQKWPEALAAARRAGATVAGGEADEATVQHVHELLKDLEFIDRLEETRMQHAAMVEGKFDYAETDRKYAGAFRDYGVDIDELAVETSIERLKGRPALVIPLAGALDEWRDVRSKISQQHAAGCGRLVAVAHGIDPEPLRDQIRSIGGQPASKGEELRRLARSINIRAHHPATLVSLAVILARSKDSEFALRLLRDAQYVYPGDFWLNFELASALSQQKDYEGAVRYNTAAMVIRPTSAAAHNNLGHVLGEQNSLDEAMTCLSKAIELDPKLVQAHLNLAKILRRQKKLDEALAAYRKAIALDPNYAKAHYGLGLTLHEQKKLDEALAAYRKAVEIDPNYANAYVGLGNSLRDQQKLDEALAAYRKAIEIDPQNVFAFNGLGIVLQDDQKKHADAVAAFRKAIEIDPRDVKAHYLLGAILCKHFREYANAAACFRKAIELEPKHADAYSGLGIALRGQNKVDEAIVAYRKAIELDPNNANSHNCLGAILCDIKQDYDAALASFLRAIELKPDFAEAWTNRGNAHARLKQHDEAIVAYRKAIELDPKSASAHNGLGISLQTRGKMDEALAAFRKAIELKPDYVEAWTNRGHAHARLKQHDEAIAVYHKAIELDPKDANAHNSLGAILCDIKQDYDAALASFLQAIALKPDHVRAWTNRGNAHVRLKQHDEAIAAYRKAIDLDPKSASAYNGIGISLQTQGKMDAALAAFRKAIEVSPNDLSAHLNLVRGLKARGKTVEAIAAAEEMVRLLPKSAPAANDFAWLLATGPDPKLRDAPRAVELATKAVELAPMIYAFRRTLGVAQYRAGNLKEAVAALEKSMELRKGGDGFDWFFLAMAHWQLGDKEAARKWYTQAVTWTDKHQPQNEDLRRVQAEAAELIGIEKKQD